MPAINSIERTVNAVLTGIEERTSNGSFSQLWLHNVFEKYIGRHGKCIWH